MLPAAYGFPAAIVLIIGGIVACFAGYRFFRVIIGAVVLVLAYFVGIALIGAGLGALIAHQVWYWIRPGDPPALIVIIAALVGAALAMVVQRYVIIVGTAFGGAWT